MIVIEKNSYLNFDLVNKDYIKQMMSLVLFSNDPQVDYLLSIAKEKDFLEELKRNAIKEKNQLVLDLLKAIKMRLVGQNFVEIAEILNLSSNEVEEYKYIFENQIKKSINLLKVFDNKIRNFLVQKFINNMIYMLNEHYNKGEEEDTVLLEKFQFALEKFKEEFNFEFQTTEADIADFDKFLEEKFEHLKEQTHKPIIPTGYKSLDNKSFPGGFEKGRLHLIAGRPGQGKSAFVLNLGINFAKQGYNVLYISMENTATETIERFVSNVLNISINEIYNEENKDRIKKFFNTEQQKLFKGRFKIKYFPTDTLTGDMLKTYIQNLDDEYDVLIVDYLDLMRETNYKEERHRLHSLTKKLKNIGQEFNMVVISPTQLNREAFKSNVSDMDKLSESSGKAFQADAVLTLNSIEVEEVKGKLRIYIAKNRYGKGRMQFLFKVDFKHMKFEDLEQEVTQEYMKSLKFISKGKDSDDAFDILEDF